MHTINPRIRIAVLLVLAAVLAAWYYISNGRAASVSGLQASGTIEAVTVNISSELAGRVAEVLVDKGQTVKADELLFRLDDTLLKAQRQQTAAALEAAQANLANAQTGQASAQAAQKSAQVALEAAQAAAEAERLPAQKALDDLTTNAPAARGQAARAVAAANRAVRNAVYQLDNFTVTTLQEDLTPTEGISLTKKMLDDARIAFEPYRNDSENSDVRKDLKEKLDNAQSEYDSAVRRIELTAALEAAQSQLKKAEDDLSRLQDGPDPQEVAILQARLAAIESGPRQAQTALEAAQVGVDAARTRLEAAQAGVLQAQAALDLIDVQLDKLAVKAPAAGVVLGRSVEPGEVVQPGASLISIGGLTQLKITVYLPEDRYGQVSLGQTVQVAVDSFPGQTFPARVTHIADQAEFTPRNVQTVEGRRNTVFAIELSIANPTGQLKPGMPADVTFGK